MDEACQPWVLLTRRRSNILNSEAVSERGRCIRDLGKSLGKRILEAAIPFRAWKPEGSLHTLDHHWEERLPIIFAGSSSFECRLACTAKDKQSIINLLGCLRDTPKRVDDLPAARPGDLTERNEPIL
jgi:hypothetical protein